MPKVQIRRPETLKAGETAPWYDSGASKSQTYFDRASEPIHLHIHDVAAGAVLTVGPVPSACSIYIWKGAVDAEGATLRAGSSLVVERRRAVALTAGAGGATLVAFRDAAPGGVDRAGGHLHLLPADDVPRYDKDALTGGSSGGLHANGECPSCHVWLHENHLPGMSDAESRSRSRFGVHSHSEAEVIFITEGSMRLGTQCVGPGTAIAIAEDTLYGFTAGPDGLSFINFRADRPTDVIMADGSRMDEVGFWKKMVAEPRYISPEPATAG